jgi:RNA recognition motif-containing protein
MGISAALSTFSQHYYSQITTHPTSAFLEVGRTSCVSSMTSKATLVVKRLPLELSDHAIAELLSRYGAEDVRSLRHAKMAGFAFARFPDIKTAQVAQAALHGTEMFGKRLVVEMAKDVEAQPVKAPVAMPVDRFNFGSGAAFQASAIAPHLGYVVLC